VGVHRGDYDHKTMILEVSLAQGIHQTLSK